MASSEGSRGQMMREYNARLARVIAGLTEAQVEEILGRPTAVMSRQAGDTPSDFFRQLGSMFRFPDGDTDVIWVYVGPDGRAFVTTSASRTAASQRHGERLSRRNGGRSFSADQQAGARTPAARHERCRVSWLRAPLVPARGRARRLRTEAAAMSRQPERGREAATTSRRLFEGQTGLGGRPAVWPAPCWLWRARWIRPSGPMTRSYVRSPLSSRRFHSSSFQCGLLYWEPAPCFGQAARPGATAGSAHSRRALRGIQPLRARCFGVSYVSRVIRSTTPMASPSGPAPAEERPIAGRPGFGCGREAVTPRARRG